MTTNTKCTVPPAGWYCTREAGHEGPCAAHQLPAPIKLWLHPRDGRTRIIQPGSFITADADWHVVGELVLRRPASASTPPNPRLYSAINNLMAHIGAHGSVDSGHQVVDDTMRALKAIDGGVYLPSLAEPTEAAAMAATVPHEKLTHEIDMVLTDPDTKLSPGAVRALQWCRTWVSVPLQLAQAPVAGQPAEPSPAIVAAARALLLAADNMVETVNLMDPFKLLELDEDPHPPSTINAGSDELERTAGQLRAILAPKGDSNG